MTTMTTIDFADIAGQEHVKRACEVAAAGGHNLLISGAPGTGKTTVAQATAALLMTETTLADLHRNPTIDHDVAERNTFMIGTVRPCSCGWHMDSERACTCCMASIAAYRHARADAANQFAMHIELPRLPWEKFISARTSETSAQIRERVERARESQRKRFDGTTITKNAQIVGTSALNTYAELDAAGQSLMRAACRQLAMTVGEYTRTLQIARTIADLAGQGRIGPAHIAEAIQYRPRRID